VSISQQRLGLMFTLVGPGGVGKNALINAVLERVKNLQQLPTATTRHIRPNEVQGREHLFVTHEEFWQMEANGELLEWQEVTENRFYGIPRATIESGIASGQDLIADIEVLGAAIIRSAYPDNVILIFVAPPTLEALEKRMRDRGDEEVEIIKRLKRAKMEMPYEPTCDYLIVNDDMETAIDNLRAIITAERSRRALLNRRVALGLPRHRIAYCSSVIVYHQGDILWNQETPNLPTTRLLPGEFPHEAAQRWLNDLLQIDVELEQLVSGSWGSHLFVPPIMLKHVPTPHFHQITFVYLFAMTEDINLPEGWSWIPAADAELPAQIRDQLSVSHRAGTGD